MSHDHNNLDDCVRVRPMGPRELAEAIRLLAGKVRQPVGAGIWEGTLEGKISGARREGPHVAVFQEQSLVAPFGPHGDPESEASAVLFVLSVQYAETIARALESAPNLQS
jgi:hypothetical protein